MNFLSLGCTMVTLRSDVLLYMRTLYQRIQQSSIYVDRVIGDRAFEMAYLQRAVEERKTSFLLSSFPFSTEKR